jgi:hypothetical protein
MTTRVFTAVAIRFFFSVFFALIFGGALRAQNWMAGYNYRKKVTINKSKVSGTVNLTNFPVLVALTSSDLQYLPGRCSGNKISGPMGCDISFAAVSTPTIPLDFQLDTYHAATGELMCWVKIPVLSASGNSAPPNEIYLYYGSNAIHQPYGTSGLKTWSNDFYKLWHMVPDDLLFRLSGSPGMGTGNFEVGRFGTALQFGGGPSYVKA